MAKASKPPLGRAPVHVAASEKQPSMLHSLPAPYTPSPQRKPVAVLICHGMGQQVPFETLSTLAGQLSPGYYPVDKVRHLHFEDPAHPRKNMWLPRAEVQVADPAKPNGKKHPVHIYEAYWAPLTEGNITLTEVIRFLATAGFGALWLSRKTFLRWLFGKDRKFKIPFSTPLGLLGTLVLVLSLVVINTVLTLVAGQNALGTALWGGTTPQLVDRLTYDLAGLLLVGLAAGISLWLSDRFRTTRFRQLFNGLAWGLLVSACLALVVAAGFMATHYLTLHNDPKPTAALVDALNQSPAPNSTAPRPPLGPWRLGLITLVWGVALAASWRLRTFFVQYLGDVAIYLDAYKVDKYHKLRQQIRQEVYRTACSLYGAREKPAAGAPAAAEPGFLYDRIIVVGHSLGSAIAYDALNATLNLDETLGRQLAVRERTGGLITFGSPLDKTAFVFHTQLPKNSLRAALAASVQPLVRDIAVREAISWVNIHSPADVISGALHFYDYPYSDKPWRIDNRLDTEASTPAAAHNQYWENPLLASTVQEAIFGRLPRSAPWPPLAPTPPAGPADPAAHGAPAVPPPPAQP